MENTIDGEVISEFGEEAQEEQKLPGFDFAPRFVQTRESLVETITERIRKHEQQLTEEELELWETKLQGLDTSALETTIARRRELIACYAHSYNEFFEGVAKDEGDAPE